MAVVHDASLNHPAWSRWVQEEGLDLRQIREEVAKSWQRCRTYRMNPLQDSGGGLPHEKLQERLDHKRPLVTTALPFLNDLYAFAKSSGFQITLTDESGVVLEVMGDRDVLQRTSAVQLSPGGDWSETARGTNAIGTAIVERKPLQINAWEHYCRAYHFLTCSASPIFDGSGTMVGVLDMSGDYNTAANPHTLGMVVAAVSTIENHLRLRGVTEQLRRTRRYTTALLENASDGLVVLNRYGVVLETNPRAASLLGIDPLWVKGRHLASLPNVGPTLLSLLADEGGRSEGEVFLESRGKRMYASASLSQNDDGELIGGVIVLREIRRRPCRFALTAHSGQPAFAEIVGESPALVTLKRWARAAAASSSAILITGEPGTGKKLFARAIHKASARSERSLSRSIARLRGKSPWKPNCSETGQENFSGRNTGRKAASWKRPAEARCFWIMWMNCGRRPRKGCCGRCGKRPIAPAAPGRLRPRCASWPPPRRTCTPRCGGEASATSCTIGSTCSK